MVRPLRRAKSSRSNEHVGPPPGVRTDRPWQSPKRAWTFGGCVALASLALVGCGGTSDVDVGADDDASAETDSGGDDATALDGAPDGSVGDVSVADATLDGADASIDARVDARDGRVDGSDATTSDDAGPDATVDGAGPDARIDGSNDGATDGSQDAAAEASADASLDASSDVSVDASNDGPFVCGTPAAGEYVVDPAGGDDATGTGVNVAGCRLRTLGRALELVAANPDVGSAAPATIRLVGDISGSTGESFPIALPSNVRVTGSTLDGAPAMRTVTASGGQSGFAINDSKVVTLSYLAIEGTSTSGGARSAIGIGVRGTNQTGISIDHVAVRGMAMQGILVGENPSRGGNLAIGPGVVVSTTGSAGTPRSGLSIRGLGVASITGGAGADQTRFEDNTEAGIQVSESGSFSLHGSTNDESVLVRRNGRDNVQIRQTPGASTNTLIDIDGLVAVASLTGHGIRIEGGSLVKVRNSVLLANATAGIAITASTAGAAASRGSIAGIDLGTDGSPGGNRLQAELTATGTFTRNLGGGLCISLGDMLGTQVLSARGNTFVGTLGLAVTCTGSLPATIVARRSCQTPGNSLPTSVSINTNNATASSVDVTTCTFALP